MHREERRVAHKGLSADLEKENLELLAWAREQGSPLVDRIDEAKAVLRGSRWFEPEVS